MENEVLGIGQLARASGLTVSALRFYDAAGVLVPAQVDAHSGYRRYRADQVIEARLVARLRRAAMPLAEIRRVLTHRCDSAQVDRLLAAHLGRLELGLSDARALLSSVRTLLDHEENPMIDTTRLTTTGPVLATALRAVRYAVGGDPEHPALHGVLLEAGPGGLTLVATDRHRLALSTVPADVDGPPMALVAPASFVDDLLAVLTEGTVTVAMADGLTVVHGSQTRTSPALDVEFPDYRRLVRTGSDPGHRVPIDVAALRRELHAQPLREIHRDGAVLQAAVLDLPVGEVGVNREFLLQALDAHTSDELVLELDGPISPLALRDPIDAGTFSLLMPIRMD